ncbi:MAG TPA: trypsin [Verrucomicrobiales bacterium]|nr:trypsin [Verrucomicrobiales bacterium]
MNLLRCFLVLLIAGLLPVSGYAAGLVIVTDPGQPDRLILPGPEPGPRPLTRIVPPVRPGMVLELVSHRVDARIKEQFATTKVVQEFKNPTGRRLEGTFLFPAPKGAQLRKFTMDVNGKPIEAELLAADKARGIYEDIVRRQRDPALLEFIDRDLYKVRIFPIEPHETKRVTLSYEQLLKSEAGLVRFVYPMSMEKFSAKPIERVALKVDFEADRALKSIYSPSHDVDISRSGEKRAIIGYETSGERAEHDFELFFSRENEGVGMSLLAYRNGDEEDGYFLLLASPGLVPDPDKVLPKDVVFVIDTSGSMAGGKLDQAKRALNFCIDNLNHGDRFEIVRFSTDIEPLFQKLAPADGPHREKARDFIGQLKPLGGTAIADALTQALRLPGMLAGSGPHQSQGAVGHALKEQDLAGRPRMIVFLTDGLPTVGETNIDRIVASATPDKDSDTRIFCFGIGTDVNTHLLDRITEATRAASEYVLPSEDIEVKVSSFFAKIKDPVLTGVVVEWPEGAGVTRVLPSRLPDLFSGEQLLVVGRYAKPGSGAVKLTGLAGGRKVLFAEDVDLPRQDSGNAFIARLWATRRIGWLLDEIRLRGENAELKEEVTHLARQHGIVTPYTAWLIVEDEERRGVRRDLQTLRLTPESRSAIEYSRESILALGLEQTGVSSTLSSRFGGRARRAERAQAAQAPVDAAASDEVFMQRYGLSPAPTTSFQRGSSRQPGAVSGPAGGGGGGTAPVQGVMTPSQLAAQSRVVGGKTFYLSETGWLDTEVQRHPDARRIKLEFGSPQYFALVKRNPAIAEWLTVGARMEFHFEDVVYEITAESQE